MPVTIGDVAQLAGVSTATVSRVLTGVGRARPETQERVVAAAAALDYRPSGIARSLKLQTTQTLGLIVTDIENPFFPELVRAVEDAAREAGFALLLCNAADEPEREVSSLDLLIERRVDGVVIAASSLPADHATWLGSIAVPVVLVNCAGSDAPRPAIRSDNVRGGEIAAEHLLGLGHRRVAILTAPPRNWDAVDRAAGARAALVAAGIAPDEIVVASGTAEVAGGEVAMAGVLARDPDVTGVVAYNDQMAIGALRAIRAAGRRVPEDVSVVGFDDVQLAAYVEPPLTTIAQATAEMGRWAVERLRELLAAGRAASTPEPGAAPRAASPEQAILPVRLVIRDSTGPAPTAALSRPPARAAWRPPAG